MASTIYSFAVSGIEGKLVEVETETLAGLPSVSIVGLGDKAVKEARERLEAAITHSNFSFPQLKIVFNLAPSDMKKTGTHFDLGMAIGLLIRTKQISIPSLYDTGFIGELSLNSYIRPVTGVLSMALKARDAGITRLIVPIENVNEASLVKNLQIYGCRTLNDVVDLLEGNLLSLNVETSQQINSPTHDSLLNFSDVKGQSHLIDYIKIAVSGGHNLLMIGPPGCGKSMIAKRIPTILPKMTEEESLEVMKLYSVANLLKQKGSLITVRPFRAPHHNASINSLIGGGTYALPGEISLAHNGVLFLDEIAEFSKKTLDSLRQPLEDHNVTITRVSGSHTYPANFMLVGAMNPCPCGYFGQEKCKCTDYEVLKYRQKLSGPILDRMDIQKYVGVVDFFDSNPKSISSKELSESIFTAREIQQVRYKHIDSVNCNAQLTPGLMRKFCKLDEESLTLLKKAHNRFHYSGRTIDKYIKIARTIADLTQSENIQIEHIQKSLLSRDLEKDHYNLLGVRG